MSRYKRERPRRKISLLTEKIRRSRAEAALAELSEKEIIARWMKLDEETAFEVSHLVPDWAWEKRFG
jgi:hypothetical protein